MAKAIRKTRTQRRPLAGDHQVVEVKPAPPAGPSIDEISAAAIEALREAASASSMLQAMALHDGDISAMLAEMKARLNAPRRAASYYTMISAKLRPSAPRDNPMPVRDCGRRYTTYHEAAYRRLERVLMALRLAELQFAGDEKAWRARFEKRRAIESQRVDEIEEGIRIEREWLRAEQSRPAAGDEFSEWKPAPREIARVIRARGPIQGPYIADAVHSTIGTVKRWLGKEPLKSRVESTGKGYVLRPR